MKGLLLIFAVIMAILSFTSAAVPLEGGLLKRVRRETCETPDDYRDCDQFCRRLGLPGGACVRKKCDCDKF